MKKVFQLHLLENQKLFFLSPFHSEELRSKHKQKSKRNEILHNIIKK